MSETHAYIGIIGGIVKAVHVDMGDLSTGEFVSDVIAKGGQIERVALDVARQAVLKPWPLTITGQ